GRNLRLVVWLLVALVVLVTVFSVVFHLLMAREGRDHSWLTGFYWTMTTMSTLGFGDITFESDAGRVFSVVVLVSGALFILVLLPFTFIQFVFTPWMEHREAARAPRRLPPDASGHIVLTNLGPIEDSLIRRADRAGVPYVVIVADLDRALTLHDRGSRVMVGEVDDPHTYRAARVEQAALVASTRSDTANSNIAFTVREFDPTVPIVVTASSEASLDVLALAGANRVLRLGHMLGEAMARRVLGSAHSHVVGSIDDLLVAEASASLTPFAGRAVGDIDVRERCGVNLVGVWERGVFNAAHADTAIKPGSVVIMTGDAGQIACFDATYGSPAGAEGPVVIVGGGRVGRAAGHVLGAAGIDWVIVEKQAARIRDPARYVEGDAADLEVLEAAGLREASAVLVTTHEDDVNVYITLYVRKLQPDIQVISRANADRNVSTLHRAGADAVLSYASLGATEIWNEMGVEDSLVVAEGLEVFRVPVPAWLAGRSLAQVDLRTRTGCNVIGVVPRGAGRVQPPPDPHAAVPADASLVVIGDAEAQARFYAAGR
ncbi:MAG TPA: NAD-binding protein, partial [Acidimicrobiales bacterium]